MHPLDAARGTLGGHRVEGRDHRIDGVGEILARIGINPGTVRIVRMCVRVDGPTHFTVNPETRQKRGEPDFERLLRASGFEEVHIVIAGRAELGGLRTIPA